MMEVYFSKNAAALRTGEKFADIIAGVSFDGNTASLRWTLDGEISERIQLTMEADGIDDLYYPPAFFETQCAPYHTYGKAFRRFLLHLLGVIREHNPGRSVLVAFAVPERESWRRGMDAYRAFLEEVFRSFDFRFAFVLVPVRTALDQNRVRNSCRITVEREWTEIYFIADDDILSFSAHIGVSGDTKPDRPVSLRMNDYVRGSTREWTDFRAPDLRSAYRTIFKDIFGIVGTGWSFIDVSAPEAAKDLMTEALSGFGEKVRVGEWPSMEIIFAMNRSYAEVTSDEEERSREAERKPQQATVGKAETAAHNETAVENDPSEEDPFDW